jgi:serine protease inhibitor
MRRRLPPFVAIVTVGLTMACGEPFGPIDQLPRELSIAEGKLIEADNRFAFRLLGEINTEEGEKNIFISPLSVGMALGMTYNGAAGGTQAAMQQVLELEDMSLQEVNESYRSLIDLLRNLDPKVEFLLANSIWYRNTMTVGQEFLDLNREYFDAEVVPLDFNSPNAGDQVNAWVDEKTKGKITEIVPAGPLSDLIMLLLNAIYFKADWAGQFDKDLTEEDPFYLADGSTVSTEMMWHSEPVPLRYHRDGGIQVVDLPYGGDAYSMTIVLPDEPEDIDALVQGLTRDQWNLWTAGLDSTSRIVSLPKFELDYKIRLNDVLKMLGMEVAFCDGGPADFSRLFPGACISFVDHKTYVKVDEEGTEAAAVTAVGVGVTSVGPPTLIIDRPFVFAIRERYSGTILFMGKMMDPTGQG